MSTEHTKPEVQIVAGDGLIALVDGWMAFARGNEDRLADLRTRLESLADATWREAVQSITEAINEVGLDEHPSVTCLCVEDTRVSAFVFRAVELTLVIDGEVHVLDGRDSTTWLDLVLRGSVDQIGVRAREGAPVVSVLDSGFAYGSGLKFQAAHFNGSDAPGLDSSHPNEALRSWQKAGDDASTGNQATVNGMFALLSDLDPSNKPEPRIQRLAQRLEVLSRSTSTATQTADDPSLFQQIEREVVRNGAAVATAPSARPELRGVNCPDGHFTVANSPNCRTCGIEIDSTAESVTGLRPVLGHLSFDDGAALAVGRPAAIGSNVPRGYSVEGEPTTTVRLDDGHGGVSAVQLEIRPAGWNVEIVDVGSEHGTFTRPSLDNQTRTRLRLGRPVTLRDGMIIEVGTRTFTFTLEPQTVKS